MRKLFINPPPRQNLKSPVRRLNLCDTVPETLGAPFLCTICIKHINLLASPPPAKRRRKKLEKNCTSSPAIKYRRSRRRSRGTKKSQQRRRIKNRAALEAREKEERRRGGEEVRKRKEGRGGNGDRETRPSLVRRIIKNSPRGPLLLFRGSLNRL